MGNITKSSPQGDVSVTEHRHSPSREKAAPDITTKHCNICEGKKKERKATFLEWQTAPWLHRGGKGVNSLILGHQKSKIHNMHVSCFRIQCPIYTILSQCQRQLFPGLKAHFLLLKLWFLMFHSFVLYSMYFFKLLVSPLTWQNVIQVSGKGGGY